MSSGSAPPIPRRAQIRLLLGLALALGFALLVLPAMTADRWLPTRVRVGEPAPFTVRVPPFAGHLTADGHVGGGGVVVARGAVASPQEADDAAAITATRSRGALPYAAYAVLAFALAAIVSHHLRRSTRGRLLRVQVANLGLVAALALVASAVMLTTSLSVLAVPVAVFALVPTLVLDRVVGLATGVLAALVTSLVVPFDASVALILLVQVAAAGLVVPERPKQRWRAALFAGGVATMASIATYALIGFVTRHELPFASGSPWLATVLGPAIATVVSVPLVAPYQRLVGEITQGQLLHLEDLSNPLLRQIATRAPGSWQHSLAMGHMAELAANAIGANGRLVRVGAYYHDLGKSLHPKYFVENLEPGETSPHDGLPAEASAAARFAHVTDGIAAGRQAGLHPRIIDFMHMHHGSGVPPQSRETAIVAICDAVEIAARSMKKPDAAAVEALVQRILHDKLHLGQLDECGLSTSDLRKLGDSIVETVRHANHGRIEPPPVEKVTDAEALAATAPTTAPTLAPPARVTSEESVTRAIAAKAARERQKPEPAPLSGEHLAARVDQILEAAEATFDAGDPTRSQSLNELEALHRVARETHEVHPDDIEAAIEVAPPARSRSKQP